MGRNSRRIKERAEEIMEGYDDAYIEALLEEIEDEFGKDSYALQAATEHFDGMCAEDIDEDTIMHVAAGLTDKDSEIMLGIGQSFTFKEPHEWAFDAVQSEIESYEDAKYEEEKDRRMGLDE